MVDETNADIATNAALEMTKSVAGGRGRTTASYELELANHEKVEHDLRLALVRERVLGDEAVHRLLNGLQMIASLLALQSREADNSELSTQLAVAAGRVSMISRIHRLLQSLEGHTTVQFKSYLEELCGDYRVMLASRDGADGIAVEGQEIELATETAIPLALVANELITNATKYGNGRVTVSLEEPSPQSYALSVRNDGVALPASFDPAASTGLGMKIIRTFAAQIGGRLKFSSDDDGQGACVTIQFSPVVETTRRTTGGGKSRPHAEERSR